MSTPARVPLGHVIEWVHRDRGGRYQEPSDQARRRWLAVLSRGASLTLHLGYSPRTQQDDLVATITPKGPEMAIVFTVSGDWTVTGQARVHLFTTMGAAEAIAAVEDLVRRRRRGEFAREPRDEGTD